jgi:hypothetical protein
MFASPRTEYFTSEFAPDTDAAGIGLEEGDEVVPPVDGDGVGAG